MNANKDDAGEESPAEFPVPAIGVCGTAAPADTGPFAGVDFGVVNELWLEHVDEGREVEAAVGLRHVLPDMSPKDALDTIRKLDVSLVMKDGVLVCGVGSNKFQYKKDLADAVKVLESHGCHISLRLRRPSFYSPA